MTPLADEADLPQAQLDADYNARATVSVERFGEEMARYRDATERARQSSARSLDIVYDAESGQTLDIYGPRPVAGERLPVFIFIHGGYWRALSKHDSAMMAQTLASQGIATVVVDYRLAPDVTLAEIVREVRASVAFVWQRGVEFGLDPDRISVGGSSAGGHLTGAVLAAGWHDEFGVPDDLVKFALPISGLFELAPLSRSFAQAWLKLGDDDVAALSPMRHMPTSGCPVTLVWASGEPAGFKRQSEAYAALWSATGATVRTIEIPDRNHFDVLMDLADPRSVLSQALLAGIQSSMGDENYS